jgi:hypothetical protein
MTSPRTAWGTAVTDGCDFITSRLASGTRRSSFGCMARRVSIAVASCAFTAALAAAGTARADEADRAAAKPARLIPYRAVEAQAVVYSHMMPRPGFGADAAFVFGTPGFQVRAGAIAVGMLPFELGRGKVGNILGAGQADICVARNVLVHQVRMCVGGQGGVMVHQWKGFERPGRRATPWAAGTLEGDYRYAFTEHVGLMAGVGVVVPVVGPSFRAYDSYGTPTPMIFPGPVAGFLSIGPSIRW